MYVLAECLGLGHCADDTLTEVIGMRAGEPKAADSSHRTDSAQQIGEIVGAVVIRIHRLAEQHHFRDSGGDHRLGFANYFRQLTTALGSTSRWHNAVGALVIAAALDRDPRFHPIEASRTEILIVLLEIEVHRGRAHADSRALDQRRKLAIAVRTDDEADVLDTI